MKKISTTIAVVLLAFCFLETPIARSAIINASNCTSATVQSAINSASNGDTVSVPAGSCSWNGINFPNSVGVSLVCANPGSCNISMGGTSGMNGNLSGTNNNFYRVSGFTFSGGGMMWWFYGPGVMNKLRIDHNTFNLSSESYAVWLGENTTIASFYGVIDNNTLNSPGNSMLLNIIGGLNKNPPASPIGTGNNMFVEDNTMNINTMTNAGLGCMDSSGSAAIVWRHNTTTNCLVTAHAVTHAGGPQNIELYNNLLKVNAGASGAGFADGTRLFHHQGAGEFIAFNNVFTAYSGKGSPIGMTHYRSATPAKAVYPSSMGQCNGSSALDGNRSPASTYYGYPCWHQPGRDFAGNLMPMYVWNNKWSDTGAKVDMNIENPWGGSNPSVQDHIKPDRDFYNAVSASIQASPSSPFNGTTGMGFGTLANRPTTCTTGKEALDAGKGGVGYFATDTNTLYRCSATNTWVVHYQPFPYPHPLIQSGSSALQPPFLHAPVVQ